MRTIHCLALAAVCAGMVSCVAPNRQIVQTGWGRCGELRKEQYFSIDSSRRLEKEVFYGFQNEKMTEVQYMPPIVEVRTFDNKGKLIHIERKNLSHLAHGAQSHYEPRDFPVVSRTKEGYTRLDYFNYILDPDGYYETTVYFGAGRQPEDPFDKIKAAMTRQQVEDLVGNPVLSQEDVSRIAYYSGIYEVTIAYDHDKVVSIESEIQKRYQ